MSPQDIIMMIVGNLEGISSDIVSINNQIEIMWDVISVMCFIIFILMLIIVLLSRRK